MTKRTRLRTDADSIKDHKAEGAPQLLQMAGHGAPWVEEQQTVNKKVTKLYWP